MLSRTRKQDPLRECDLLLSNIKAMSYIIAYISIRCPTVRHILIKLHHSEEKYWSCLSSSGWNDFILCLQCDGWWNAGLKNRSEQTKQNSKLGCNTQRTVTGEEKRRLIFYQQSLFVFLWICPHILIEWKLFKLAIFSLKTSVSSVAPKKTFLTVLFIWR